MIEHVKPINMYANHLGRMEWKKKDTRVTVKENAF